MPSLRGRVREVVGEREEELRLARSNDENTLTITCMQLGNIHSTHPQLLLKEGRICKDKEKEEIKVR